MYGDFCGDSIKRIYSQVDDDWRKCGIVIETIHDEQLFLTDADALALISDLAEIVRDRLD